MANNTNLQNTVVSAGKFITTGTSMSLGKQSLRDIRASMALEDNTFTIEKVKEMQDSDGFSKKEKQELRSIYDGLIQKFQTINRLVSSVNYSGDDWDTMREKYSAVCSEFGKVLYDMESDYTVDTNLSMLLQQYNDYLQTFSISLNQYISAYDGYQISLTMEKTLLEEGDPFEVTLNVYDPNGVQYILSDSEKSTIVWYFSNTVDDTGLEEESRGVNPLVIEDWDSIFTGRSIEISASLTIYPN